MIHLWVLFNGISTSVGHLMPKNVRFILASRWGLEYDFNMIEFDYI